MPVRSPPLTHPSPPAPHRCQGGDFTAGTGTDVSVLVEWRQPISYLIPCHRAIARDGRLTGYHWGLARKAAMLGHEAVMTASA
jgi:hypothetical protein